VLYAPGSLYAPLPPHDRHLSALRPCPAAARMETRRLLARVVPGGDDESAVGADEAATSAPPDDAETEELQDALDAELLALQQRLRDIKNESAAVAARKAVLEMELSAMLREGMGELEADFERMGVLEEDGEEQADGGQAVPAAAVEV
jgi:hypothetical protein